MSLALFLILVAFAMAAFNIASSVNLIAVGLFFTTLATAVSVGQFFK